MRQRRHELWDLPFDALTMEETLQWIEDAIVARVPRQHTVINAAKVVNAGKDAFLKQSIAESDLINIDGQAVVWAARLLGVRVPERVAGIDLMWKLLERANEKKYRVFFFGATQEVLDTLIARVRREFPSVEIAGSRNGYYSEAEAEKIAETIRDSKADILFVGMPTPRKEKFIHRFLKTMNVPFAMGVGGSFDVLAGKVQRAPVWMQKASLEWFYRLMQEPRRLFARYAVTNAAFLYIVARESARLYKERESVSRKGR